MSDAAAILHDARASAGMSARALAFKAGASTTTVTRIEAGTMDPTVGMLTRLLAASGRALELSMRDSQASAASSLADLAEAWTTTAMGDRPDWTRLRAFLDSLALHPHRTRPAITPTPPPSGSAMLDALLAGMADKLADDRGLRRPGWTNAPDRFLSSQWETPGTPRMRQAARDQTPPQLLAHGIIVSQDSLWREPTTLGIASGA
ncbi:MAG: helix-turn-helix domain-containing protein [Actinomycetota bacterium]|nr:helix-turn-helix domain-containing protein [Actinomycetota bacterium]